MRILTFAFILLLGFSTSVSAKDSGIPGVPKKHEERVICCLLASLEYGVPTDIMLAVAEIEAGSPGLYKRNENGTYDIGTMQVNTSWLAELKAFGITADDVAAAGCYSYRLAAWRLNEHIKKDSGDIYTRAANYHSRTDVHNRRYRGEMIIRAHKWSKWLQTFFECKLVSTVN